MASCTVLTSVPVHAFYHFLIDQTLHEASARTGRDYKEDDLSKGIKYHYYNTKYKKEDTIHIRPPVKDTQLSSTWTQDGRSVRITWNLKAVDDTHTEVTNIQEYMFKAEESEKQDRKFNRIMKREICQIDKQIHRQQKKGKPRLL